jgi:hypothetical protein
VAWVLFTIPVEVLTVQGGLITALLEEGGDGGGFVPLIPELLKPPSGGNVAFTSWLWA